LRPYALGKAKRPIGQRTYEIASADFSSSKAHISVPSIHFVPLISDYCDFELLGVRSRSVSSSSPSTSRQSYSFVYIRKDSYRTCTSCSLHLPKTGRNECRVGVRILVKNCVVLSHCVIASSRQASAFSFLTPYTIIFHCTSICSAQISIERAQHANTTPQPARAPPSVS
jgi:hypothetical protein